MSLVDNTSEAGPSDLLEANDDAGVAGADALSNTNINCFSTIPTPPLYEWSLKDDRPTPDSKGHGAIRRARSTARHSEYRLPSREQRRAFLRSSRRKEMFVDDPCDFFIPAPEPSTISSTADLALHSVHTDVAATLAELHLSTMPHDTYCVTQKSDLTIKTTGPVDRLALRLQSSCNVSEQIEEDEDVADRATQRSGLTIKIPDLVDRLALRLLTSLNVEERTKEAEDVDSMSLDGYNASESSSDGSDIDDDHTSHSCSSSPVSAAVGPNRSSRRKHCTAAPYHRAVKIPKRKEMWVDTDTRPGSEVPAFLLGSPPRLLRSGRRR